MRRTGDTIRNPGNWDIDGGLPDDVWSVPEDGNVELYSGGTGDIDGDLDNTDEPNEVEDIADIREYERRTFYTELEQRAIRDEMLAGEQRYYDDYADWYNERIEQGGRKIEEIDIPREITERYSVLSDLPHGVCVMGGMARSIAREVITGDVEPIRDIDLVNIVDGDGKSLVSDDKLDELSRKYMPDDYAFGYGIKSEELTDYFETRDFTINQCLIRDGKLLVTRQAYDDFQENIIRPTEYELPDRKSRLSSRLFMKALMMRTALETVTSSIPTMEDVRVYLDEIRPFDVALTLNKMMSRGVEMAHDYVDELVDWDILPEEYKGRPMHAARFLLDYVYRFEFRSTETDGALDENGFERSGQFSEDALNRYYSRNPEINNIVDEYDGLMPSDFVDDSSYDEDDERIAGRYTLGDYRWMNRMG